MTTPQIPEERGRLKLLGLRRWRLERGMSQEELSRAIGMHQATLSKIEIGKLRCDHGTAQKIAELLEVDLEKLQEAPEERAVEPMTMNLILHRAYLKRTLTKEVGSAYSAFRAEELGKYCRKLTWEEVLDVLSCRRRELEYLRQELEDAELHPEVRRFYEDIVRTAPDQDIRLLASAREWEATQKGREQLTRAMRELL